MNDQPLPKIRKTINTLLSQLPAYCDGIPMDSIMGICDENGLTVVDEAGERWSGIFCGEAGYTNFRVVGARKDLYIHLTWYKMPSGRYEIVVYMS